MLVGGKDGQTKLIVQAMVFELLGSMLLTFLYLTQTEEKTKLSGDPAITTMIISATYTCLTYYSIAFGVVSGSPFNPAIALGEFWAVLFGGNYDSNLSLNMWVCLFFSYGGALIAVLLFEFVYKRAIDSVQEVEQMDSDGEADDAEAKLMNA